MDMANLKEHQQFPHLMQLQSDIPQALDALVQHHDEVYFIVSWRRWWQRLAFSYMQIMMNAHVNLEIDNELNHLKCHLPVLDSVNNILNRLGDQEHWHHRPSEEES